jgi:hypothetical protein
MYLEASAMVLLELHRALEADRSRETRAAARRTAMLEALGTVADDSDGLAGVSIGDRASGGGESGPDLGRVQDLEPGPGPEQRQRGFVRPVQAQPKS